MEHSHSPAAQGFAVKEITQRAAVGAPACLADLARWDDGGPCQGTRWHQAQPRVNTGYCRAQEASPPPRNHPCTFQMRALGLKPYAGGTLPTHACALA